MKKCSGGMKNLGAGTMHVMQKFLNVGNERYSHQTRSVHA